MSEKSFKKKGKETVSRELLRVYANWEPSKELYTYSNISSYPVAILGA